jgi:ribonuclease HI
MTEIVDDVDIYADGACKGNPAIGGWGALLSWQDQTLELHGGSDYTTNNKMELQAAIEGLAILTRPCRVRMYLDSQYVLNGITQWRWGWKKRHWKTKEGEDVKNAEQWKALDHLLGKHKVRCIWVKGHSGNVGNERADKLSNIYPNQNKR